MVKLSFLSFIFTLFASQPASVNYYGVIGYINQQPVNDFDAERKLYLLKDGDWQEYASYPEGYQALFVTDSFTCFQKKDSIITRYASGKTDVFYRKGLGNAVVGKDGTICFTDKESKGYMLCKTGTTVKKLNVKGWPVAVSDQHLIYFNYVPVKDGEDDVLGNFYDMRLDIVAPPVVIFKKGFPDNTLVSPDRKFILTGNSDNDANGNPQRLLVDVAGKRVSKLLVDADKKDNCYYSYQDKAFVFFNLENMQKQVFSPGKQKWIPFK